MRHVRLVLICLLCLPALALFAGCGSTEGGSPTPASSFTLTADSSITVIQGQSQTITVTPSSANSFKGSVTISASGLPAGVTMSPASATIAIGSSTTFTLSAAATAAAGTSSVTIQGVSGSLSASTMLAVSVTAVPSGPTQNFTLAVSPATLTLAPGTSGQVTLKSTAATFAGVISVVVNGLPAGVTASPATIALSPGTPERVTLTAAPTTAPTAGLTAISFTGTSGASTRTAILELSVTAAADFSLTATPSMTVAQGSQSDLVEIGVAGIGGFSGSVGFTVSGLPNGVIAAPASSTLFTGESQPLVFIASDSAPLGTSTVTITGVSGSISHSAQVALTVTPPIPPVAITMSVSPSSVAIPIRSFREVIITADASPGFSGLISVRLSGLPAGVTATPSTVTLSPGSSQTVVLAAGAKTQPSAANVTVIGQYLSVTGTAALNLQVVTPPAHASDVPTWHYDAGRTGLNPAETSLTLTNVAAATFGKLSATTTDGAVDAQPLFVSGLMIGAQAHNVLYVATENDTVYAYDADTGVVLWQNSALGASETAADDQGCNEVSPKVGITSTPVIDRNYLANGASAANGAIFFVAMSKDSAGNYHQRLHGLDLTTGAELSGGPVEITASYPGNGASSDGTTNTFVPGTYVERAALLLSNSTLYLAWAAPCQQPTVNSSSWVMAYSEASLQQQSVLNLTPNGSGGSIGLSGSGPAADDDGNIFLATSKGTFDTTLDGNRRPVNGNYGNGYIKIGPSTTALSVLDYFEPLNGVPGSANYQDQGSGGVMLLPGVSTGVIGAGMDGNIYEMGQSTGAMGGYNGTSNNNPVTLTNALPGGAASTPAYFNQLFYYGGIGDALKAYKAFDSSAAIQSQSQATLGATGATPVISANGTSDGILWALDSEANGGPVLHAYNAADLTKELYNTSQAQSNGAARDTIRATGKYVVPVVANGHVYVGTQSGVDILGLLP